MLSVVDQKYGNKRKRMSFNKNDENSTDFKTLQYTFTVTIDFAVSVLEYW